ncbi:MAG TPA: SxtJ family membrane protein [Planctomycetota bacterium]|jgi:hypothetical protein|nr:SxtJ family membrane protein [Planctomycetota bacterium]
MALVKLNTKPSPIFLRQFGFLSAAILAGLAWYIHTKGGFLGFQFPHAAGTVAYVLAGLAALTGLLSAVFPRANLPLYLTLAVVTFPIGFVMSYVVMALVFYLVVTPIGLLLRIFGRDPLSRRISRQATSYWIPRGAPRPASRYFRQY